MSQIKKRFRGFLPVVVDIETSGLDPQTNAILEITAVMLEMDDAGLRLGQTYAQNVLPFEGAVLNEESLAFNGVHDPYHPLRGAVDEAQALEAVLAPIRAQVEKENCQRAILVAHNAWFDLHFLSAAMKRCGLKSPFHAFSSLDTATMGMLVYKHTVLPELVKRAKIDWCNQEAHSAIYDAKKAAELFCKIINMQDQIIDD